ncbi:hypothetical protein CAPTEDRAFT_204342 [Capitella teleta]|uniref:RNase H type-1 domain-containing protein n=1 Tax=Capitella teleta TaxID=283909 RepID=R7TGM3_CAPTE|nr:hypothetical protein CAPTEDRAFT_204342 [Capitella teleta]|eukprot:ELT92824.1 hypothetical protein CAPTEDRAFT_204342 [Capitella teleta]
MSDIELVKEMSTQTADHSEDLELTFRPLRASPRNTKRRMSLPGALWRPLRSTLRRPLRKDIPKTLKVNSQESLKNIPWKLIGKNFKNLLGRYPNFYIFYTDGSKSKEAIGCGFHSRDFNLALGLSCQMSVYTAELIAINETLTSIALLPYDEFVICTDSLSSILAISSIDFIHPYVQSIFQKCTCLAGRDKRIIFIWCPSHVGIPENETLAKQALGMNILNCPIPHTAFKPIARSFVKTQRQSEWDQETGNELHDIQPDIGSWPPCQREKRREEIVIARLRIGHTFLLTVDHLL